jgi:hypothetical protein
MKPTHAKPQLYAYYFLQLKDIAKEFGYNLVVHGSINRDLDLIAIPWVDDPKDEFEMIRTLAFYLNGEASEDRGKYLFTVQPGGRHNYVINLNRGGYKRNENGDIADPIHFTPDPEYYLDISVTPFTK